MTHELVDQLRGFADVLEQRAPAIDLNDIRVDGNTAGEPRRRAWMAVAAVAVFVTAGLGAIAITRPDPPATTNSTQTTLAAAPLPPPSTEVEVTECATCQTFPDGVVAHLVAPSIGLDIDVGGSDEAEDLQVRPGLMSGSSPIGQPGLAKIWGTRTTYLQQFRRLDEFELGDTITATTAGGEFAYHVTAIDEVPHGTADPEVTGSAIMLVVWAPKWTSKQEIRVLADQTPIDTVEVSFERIAFTESFEAECVDPLPSEGWTTSEIVSVADATGQRWRTDFRYPDSTGRAFIAFDDPWKPTNTESSGEWQGATLGCAFAGGRDVIMVAEPGQGSFYSLNPMASIPPPVQDSPIAPAVPSVITYRDLGEQQAGLHRDSRGREAQLWVFHTTGLGGTDGQAPLTETQEWFVDPDTGQVLEHHYQQHIDGIGTANRTATLIETGTADVPASSLSQPDTPTTLS